MLRNQGGWSAMIVSNASTCDDQQHVVRGKLHGGDHRTSAHTRLLNLHLDTRPNAAYTRLHGSCNQCTCQAPNPLHPTPAPSYHPNHQPVAQPLPKLHPQVAYCTLVPLILAPPPHLFNASTSRAKATLLSSGSCLD